MELQAQFVTIYDRPEDRDDARLLGSARYQKSDPRAAVEALVTKLALWDLPDEGIARGLVLSGDGARHRFEIELGSLEVTREAYIPRRAGGAS